MTDTFLQIFQGTLKGKIVTTETGLFYSSYQGIPYARPPIGDLRFQDPKPADGWAGIRDASKETDVSAQVDWIFSKGSEPVYIGSEDSLYLNVYAPQKEDESDSKLPVMFWIHGGGFMMGSGNSDYYGPDYLIEHNVVIVTFNYRLGPLGFLCLHTEQAPGNLGLKDQIMALKWVKKNIEMFGGDADNITIFGESAGGAAVQLLILSDMANGLFHKAICQSGSCENSWAIQSDPEANVFALAGRLGLNTTNKVEIFNNLKNVPVEKLVKAAYETSHFDKKGELRFLPVIEQVHPNHEPFITILPSDAMDTGRFTKVPTITGFNTKEGVMAYYKYSKISKDLSLGEIKPDFQSFLMPSDKNKFGPKRSAETAAKIEEFYFPKNVQESDVLDNYVDLVTDYGALIGIDKCAKMFGKFSSPAYYYKFSFNGSLNLMKYLCRCQYTGAAHLDELGYLFKNTTLPEDTLSNLSTDDIRTINRLTKMWTDFAKHGNPTPILSENIEVIWKPITESEINCMEIDTDLKMMQHPFCERLKFWETLWI